MLRRSEVDFSGSGWIAFYESDRVRWVWYGLEAIYLKLNISSYTSQAICLKLCLSYVSSYMSQAICLKLYVLSYIPQAICLELYASSYMSQAMSQLYVSSYMPQVIRLELYVSSYMSQAYVSSYVSAICLKLLSILRSQFRQVLK
jgi:hypothetical protein